MKASVVAALGADASPAGAWVLDPAASSVRLRSRSMWGLVPVRGVFGDVRGSGTVNAGGEVTGTLTVAAASIDTKNAKRDRHLRSADLLDADNHPDITFSATSVQPGDGGGLRLGGSLTVGGRTLPLTVEVAVSIRPDGGISLDAEVRVDRSQYAMTQNAFGGASMRNVVVVHAVFRRI